MNDNQNKSYTNIPWDDGEVLEGIERVVRLIRARNDRKLMLQLGDPADLYREFKQTKNPIALEDIIMSFAGVFETLLGSVDTDADTKLPTTPTMGFLTTNNISRNSQDWMLEKRGSDSLSEEATFTLEELLRAFEEKNRADAAKKGILNPSTARIYDNCLRRELIFENEQSGLLWGPITREEVKDAILSAIDRIKTQKHCMEAQGEVKRYKTNELAALNKLKKNLDELVKNLKVGGPLLWK